MTAHREIYEYTRLKSIAIVGNSQGQFSRIDGDAIENHDVIVRMNRGLVVDRHVQGIRTDILSLSIVPDHKMIAKFSPKYIMWATPKRENMPEDLNLFVHPDKYWLPLYKHLGARPSTGLITLNYFVNHLLCGPRSLYGFDSWKTPTFYTKQRRTGPHSPEREQEFIQGLVGKGRIAVINDDS